MTVQYPKCAYAYIVNSIRFINLGRSLCSYWQVSNISLIVISVDRSYILYYVNPRFYNGTDTSSVIACLSINLGVILVPAKLTKEKLLQRHVDSLTKSNIKIDRIDLPTLYSLPKLHTTPYKSRFISNTSHCSTTILSEHMISALTAVEDHSIKYSQTAFSNCNVNYFWSIKNSSEVIEKLRSAKL